MQVGYGLETILDRVELHQCHVFLVGVAENLYCFDLSVFAEDFVKRMLAADLFLQ